MIVACPQCAARYRVDPQRVGPSGARLRCAKCESVFRVASPTPQPVEAPAPPEQVPAPAVPQNQFPPEAPPPDFDRERSVLIADTDPESAKNIAAALSEWGLSPLVALDGVEAMLAIQRMLPRVIVLDSALTKMYGFQVCEIVKRNESLRSIHVVLMGSIHHADRYRRPPVELYGADVYLEKPDLPDALLQCLRQFGMPLTAGSPEVALEAPTPPPPAPLAEAPSTSLPEAVADPAASFSMPEPVAETTSSLPPPAPAEPPAPAPEPAAPAPAQAPEPDGDPRLADQRATAQRLARIIVSDIVLYNPDKFEEAVRAGNVAEALNADLQEGRALFRQRIDSEVLEERDYLVEELVRVAREKGMV